MNWHVVTWYGMWFDISWPKSALVEFSMIDYRVIRYNISYVLDQYACASMRFVV